MLIIDATMLLRLKNNKRPAIDGPSPPASNPSDTNMNTVNEIAQMAQLLRPQQDSMSKKLDTIIGDLAGIKAENAALKSFNAALKTRMAQKKPRWRTSQSYGIAWRAALRKWSR